MNFYSLYQFCATDRKHYGLNIYGQVVLLVIRFIGFGHLPRTGEFSLFVSGNAQLCEMLCKLLEYDGLSHQAISITIIDNK